MYQLPKLSRRAKWAVPAGVVVAVGGVMAGSLISVAQATPALPARTPAQLLAAIAGDTSPPPALTGTVVETVSLGLPDLPGTGNPTSITSLLTGSHTIRVWYGGPGHIRLAVPESMSESDLIRNGTSAWFWQSSTNTVTHYQLRAGDEKVPAGSGPAQAPLTPQQAASQVLAEVGPTTTVRVDSNVVVAGEAAYQLVLAPRDTRSLVGQVRIAVDGRNNVPLRVQVIARGASSAALQVGFTSISFVAPAAANFTFTPPPGAKVVQESLAPGKQGSPRADGANSPSVIGQGWLAVAMLPASALSGLPGNASSAGDAISSSAHAASGSAPAAVGGGGTGENAAILGALLRSATPVHGSWGSGQLLRTSLVSVLITSNGRIFAGAVAPSVLYSAAQSGAAQSGAAQKG